MSTATREAYLEGQKKELMERLVQLEKNGEDNNETLPQILRGYPANLACFEESDVFALVVRICLQVYSINQRDIADLWGMQQVERVIFYSRGALLPLSLSRPGYIQGLLARFDVLLAKRQKTAA